MDDELDPQHEDNSGDTTKRVLVIGGVVAGAALLWWLLSRSWGSGGTGAGGGSAPAVLPGSNGLASPSLPVPSSHTRPSLPINIPTEETPSSSPSPAALRARMQRQREAMERNREHRLDLQERMASFPLPPRRMTVQVGLVREGVGQARSLATARTLVQPGFVLQVEGASEAVGDGTWDGSVAALEAAISAALEQASSIRRIALEVPTSLVGPLVPASVLNQAAQVVENAVGLEGLVIRGWDLSKPAQVATQNSYTIAFRTEGTWGQTNVQFVFDVTTPAGETWVIRSASPDWEDDFDGLLDALVGFLSRSFEIYPNIRTIQFEVPWMRMYEGNFGRPVLFDRYYLRIADAINGRLPDATLIWLAPDGQPYRPRQT